MNAIAHLQPRTMEVVGLVAEGLSNREIGRRLGLSPHSIKRHLNTAGFRLGITGKRTRIRIVRQIAPITGTLQLPPSIKFTVREARLVQLMVLGTEYRYVAAEWETSEQVVRNVARSIFDKTGMDSRAEVVAWYRAHCVPAQ